VVQQTPAPGNSDITSPHIDLLVSLGPGACLRDAGNGRAYTGRGESKLVGSGLKLSKLTFSPFRASCTER